MRSLKALGLLLGATLVGAWAARRQGWLDFPPAILAAGAGLLIALLLGASGARLRAAARPAPGRLRAGAAGLAAGGLALALGGGLANWLFSLQGYVVLIEGERAALSPTDQLQGYEAGPLARVGELGVTLGLDELELRPVEDGRFQPWSHVSASTAGGPLQELLVAPGSSAAFGPLRFHQGAFGFAPRLVILDGERTILDRSVPFSTELVGAGALSFRGRFSVAAERLDVAGQVDLATLDEGLRGHARLGLEVRREGRLLGRGELLPGHFAAISEGYRVGFAGLKRWSELDVSRRNYAVVVRAGAVLAAAAALAWGLASLAGWRPQ